MPLQQTSGNVTSDAYGGGTAVTPVYIEDVMSTFLYTGNSATNSIANGIDLAGKGGLVWIKNRTFTTNNFLADTARGIGGVGGSTYYVASNSTGAQSSDTNLMSVGATGFTLLPNATSSTNGSYDYSSWTFRKQPKFFDVVTYTGDGVSGRTVAHSLGSVPGCIIVKNTSDGTRNWAVYHRSLGGTQRLILNTTDAAAAQSSIWNDTDPTSTVFTVGNNANTNANGATYVAYLFAHDAGGFGLTGTDNVISCGSFTGNTTVNLGYEPQWIMIKKTNAAGSWTMWDTMRGWSQTQQVYLYADLSNAESSSSDGRVPNATGFTTAGYTPTDTFIYIAIRRGPMKVPTDATKVFAAQNNRNGPGSATAPSFVSNFPVDMFMRGYKPGASASFQWLDDRLRQAYLVTSATDAEAAIDWKFDCQTGVYYQSLASSTSEVGWMFKRAPSFFDEVCYTGTGSITTVTHNLGVAPELIIAKSRSGAFAWTVYSAALGTSYPLFLNYNSDGTTNYGTSMWGSAAPTATQFSVGTYTGTNSNGQTYAAYLFASCPGISKVGSYTGNGTTQTINCGFTGGARFVLIKATSTTGNWMTFDTARGMTTLTDPFLSLNSTAAETATLGACTTVSTGFAINESILTGVNTSGVSYIFLSVA